MASDEMFYVDANGVRQDAALHEELLDNPQAEARADEGAIIQALKLGYTREEALKLLGK